MPRIDSVTGVPVMTLPEFFAAEARSEGKGRTGGEVMAEMFDEIGQEEEAHAKRISEPGPNGQYDEMQAAGLASEELSSERCLPLLAVRHRMARRASWPKCHQAGENMTVQLNKETVINYITIIIEAVNEAGDVGVGSSYVYLAFQQQGVEERASLQLYQYEQLIDLAVKSGLLTKQAHCLRITEKGRALLADVNKIKAGC